MINTSTVHRHPKYWPQPTVRREDSVPYPVSSFQPETWLSKQEPFEGVFVPFANGFRACMGSRLARVGFCAALAFIVRNYIVQLEGGTDTGTLKAGEEQLSADVGFELGLELREPLAMRFVRV